MLRLIVAKYLEPELKAKDFEAATPRQIQKGGKNPETDVNVYDMYYKRAVVDAILA